MVTCTEVTSISPCLACPGDPRSEHSSADGSQTGWEKGKGHLPKQLAMFFLMQPGASSGIEKGLALGGTVDTKLNCINFFVREDVWDANKKALAQDSKTQQSVRRNIKKYALRRTMYELGKSWSNLKNHSEIQSNVTWFWKLQHKNLQSWFLNNSEMSCEWNW